MSKKPELVTTTEILRRKVANWKSQYTRHSSKCAWCSYTPFHCSKGRELKRLIHRAKSGIEITKMMDIGIVVGHLSDGPTVNRICHKMADDLIKE